MSERIGNPFVSAALIACIIINWKLSLLLFADISYDERVAKIIQLYPDHPSRLYGFLIYPIAFGAFWTFLWPIINLGINAYWYRMKSFTSNVKIWAERKRRLSESEAAELYSTIDSQEIKYLEMLKERQGRVDSLTHEVSSLISGKKDLEKTIDELSSSNERLNAALENTKLSIEAKSNSEERIRRERDEFRREVEEIHNISLDFVELLPGLKPITNAINKSTNHQANEAWMWEEFSRQEPSFTAEERHKMLNFFLALGLIKKDVNGLISFGDRYKFTKDKVLGIFNNSPSQKIPQGVAREESDA